MTTFDPLRHFQALAGAAVVAVSALATTTAFAQQLNTVAVLAAPEPVAGDERTAGRDAPLLTQAMHPELAVKLGEPVTVPLSTPLGTSAAQRTLPAGTILTGSSARAGTYCTLTFSYFDLSACLVDADGDGRFEGARTAKCTTIEADELLFTEDGALCGGALGKDVQPLANRPKYAPCDPAERPTRVLQLTWGSDYSRKRPAKPVRIWFDLTPVPTDHRTSEARSLSVQGREFVLPPGGVGQVKIGGALIQLLGFSPEGALRYRIERALSAQPVRFWHGVVHTIVVVVPG